MCSRLSARTESQGAGKTLAPLSMKRSAAMDIIRPEVLAPAGDAERLKAAVYYGADAVYMGGTRFGMRAAPKNFSDDELARAVSFAHENDVKVYLTCNIIPTTAEPECPKKWSSNVSSTAQCASHIQDAVCSQTILPTGTQIKASALSPAAGNTASWSAPVRANISPLKKLRAAHI